MTGKHLSFRPGNGRCWAVFRLMDRNGKRTHERTPREQSRLSDKRHLFRRALRLVKRLTVLGSTAHVHGHGEGDALRRADRVCLEVKRR